MQIREKRTNRSKENKREGKVKMRKTKQGISLIVLVITIIVMIILAAAVIISLNNNGIINRANEAVNATNLAEVQHLASLAWSEAYLDNMNETDEEKKLENIKSAVEKAFIDNNLNVSDYDLTYGAGGVTVIKKEVKTLGSLITAADYGKKVTYSVTVDGKEYKNWRVYYEDEDNKRVFIISDSLGEKGLGEYSNSIYTAYGDALTLTSEQLNVYRKFKLEEEGYTLNLEASSSDAVAYLITEFADFAKTTENYVTYVEGAIGCPTIELFCAGWNAWNEAKKLEDATHTYIEFTPTIREYGYLVNEKSAIFDLPGDGFYIPTEKGYWMASPCGWGLENLMLVTTNTLTGRMQYTYPYNICPVVCLNSDIPASVNADGTGFEI